MRLQKRLGRKYKDKKYYKWIVNIPEVFLLSLGWKEGDEIDFKIDNKSLILNKAENTSKNIQNDKTTL